MHGCWKATQRCRDACQTTHALYFSSYIETHASSHLLYTCFWGTIPYCDNVLEVIQTILALGWWLCWCSYLFTVSRKRFGRWIWTCGYFKVNSSVRISPTVFPLLPVSWAICALSSTSTSSPIEGYSATSCSTNYMMHNMKTYQYDMPIPSLKWLRCSVHAMFWLFKTIFIGSLQLQITDITSLYISRLNVFYAKGSF